MTTVVNFIRHIGKIALFTQESFSNLIHWKIYFIELIEATQSILVRCMFPVISVVTAFGMVIALQGTNVFRIFGTEYMVAGLLSLGLIRELSPTITAIMVAAQAGSSNAAEVGTMRIREEIDALSIMGV